MSRIKLNFKGITGIAGTTEVGLIVLVDEQETRQLVIPCDHTMMFQFELRFRKHNLTERMLPEVLWNIIQTQIDIHFAIEINNLVNGEYKTILYNINTLDIIPIRLSDAMLLAYISNIPIYINQNLMAKQSVEYKEGALSMAVPVNTITDEMLQDALQKAINDENYELASHLRDEMKRREQVKNK